MMVAHCKVDGVSLAVSDLVVVQLRLMIDR